MDFRLFICVLMLQSAISSALAGLGTPTLQWSRKGTTGRGWYSGPLVVDVDGDGIAEVFGSNYDIARVNGSDGATVWRAASGCDLNSPSSCSNRGRVWPAVAYGDVDGDGKKDIVIGTGQATVVAMDVNGRFLPNFPASAPSISSEFRSLVVSDLNGNGKAEIIAGLARGNNVNLWVFDSNGQIRRGWPQNPPPQGVDTGYTWGIYSSSTSVGDFRGNGKLQILAPSDVHYVQMYNDDGTVVNAKNGTFGNRKAWGAVGFDVKKWVEQRGWSACSRGSDTVPDSLRVNFASSSSAIADMDGDGTKEIIVIGISHDCTQSPYEDYYHTPFIVNFDRTRWAPSAKFNWTETVIDPESKVKVDNYNVIESCHPYLSVGDLDGDGIKEFLFPSFAEVIFGTWTDKSSGVPGRLFVLDYQGNQLFEAPFPYNGNSGEKFDGPIAGGSLGNIDSDPEMEIVFTTAFSGMVAFHLPGSANARIQWGTSRGNVARTGEPAASQAFAAPNPNAVDPGDSQSAAFTIPMVWAAILLSLTVSLIVVN